MAFLKKHFTNILFVLFIFILLGNPFGLGTKIRSKMTQLISFSPSVISEDQRVLLKKYDWVLINENQEKIDFNRFKGEVVFVNYWATWCPPCVAEMPSIQKLYNDYGTKVKFVLISNDDKTKITKFMSENDYTFPIYYEQTASPKELESSSIPITFLINRKGEIVISKKGSADWNSKKTRKIIESLL